MSDMLPIDGPSEADLRREVARMQKALNSLRRELEMLRDDLLDTPHCAPLADLIDAILAGGES